MANKPLVSVIIPSYNHEDYIKKSIKSALNQKVIPLEVIMIDDGSSDQTCAKAREIKDPRLKIISLKENRRYHPRNFGLNLARGKYIAFLNSDDYWKKNKLLSQLKIIENSPKIVAVFTQVKIVNQDDKNLPLHPGNYVFKVNNRGRFAWLRHFFDYGNCFCISSALIRRKTINQIGGLTANLFQLSDFDLWIRLAAQGEFHSLEKKLTVLRIIGRHNLSYPTPGRSNLKTFELAEVLNNYAKKEIRTNLDKIFPEIINQGETKVVALGKLARYSWHKSTAHILFANNLLGKLINGKKKEKLLDYFGPLIIKEYINKRKELKLIRAKELEMAVKVKSYFFHLWQLIKQK